MTSPPQQSEASAMITGLAVLATFLVLGFVIGYVVGDIRGWRRSMRELRELADRYGWGAVEKYLKDELGVRP